MSDQKIIFTPKQYMYDYISAVCFMSNVYVHMYI